MSLKKEEFKINASLGIFVSILIFFLLGIIFMLAAFFSFSFLGPPTDDFRVKAFAAFFYGTGFNGLTVLEICFVINTGLFISSLFLFIKNIGKK